MEHSKKKLIEKLTNQMAQSNNTIDLDAYTLGLNNMFDCLQTIKEPEEKSNFKICALCNNQFINSKQLPLNTICSNCSKELRGY